jgi:dUTP pyrophosphatase
MVISGSEISKNLMVTGGIFEGQEQPAGFDLTVAKISRFEGAGAIDGDNSKRKLPATAELSFPPDNKPLHLPPGPYKVQFNELVKIPADCIALAFPRSSLLRMGVSAHNAVWDPGYEGRSEGLINVSNPNGVDIYKNAKLVQIVFMRIEGGAKSQYSGIYHKENTDKRI